MRHREGEKLTERERQRKRTCMYLLLVSTFGCVGCCCCCERFVVVVVVLVTVVPPFICWCWVCAGACEFPLLSYNEKQKQKKIVCLGFKLFFSVCFFVKVKKNTARRGKAYYHELLIKLINKLWKLGRIMCAWLDVRSPLHFNSPKSMGPLCCD